MGGADVGHAGEAYSEVVIQPGCCTPDMKVGSGCHRRSPPPQTDAGLAARAERREVGFVKKQRGLGVSAPLSVFTAAPARLLLTYDSLAPSS